MGRDALLIFDIDHTLLDTFSYQSEALSRALAQYLGIRASLSDLQKSGAGMMTPQIIRDLAVKHGVPQDTVDSRLDDIISSISSHLKSLLPSDYSRSLLPGVPDVLVSLMAHFPLAVISGNPRLIAEHLLTWARIRSLFTYTSFAESLSSRQQLIERSLAQHASDQHKPTPGVSIFLIGDSVNDMTSAVLAGIIPIGVTTGFHDRQDLESAGARYVFPSLRGLPALFLPGTS
jgi:phosphoglycolate phosphatase